MSIVIGIGIFLLGAFISWLVRLAVFESDIKELELKYKTRSFDLILKRLEEVIYNANRSGHYKFNYINTIISNKCVNNQSDANAVITVLTEISEEKLDAHKITCRDKIEKECKEEYNRKYEIYELKKKDEILNDIRPTIEVAFNTVLKDINLPFDTATRLYDVVREWDYQSLEDLANISHRNPNRMHIAQDGGLIPVDYVKLED